MGKQTGNGVRKSIYLPPNINEMLKVLKTLDQFEDLSESQIISKCIKYVCSYQIKKLGEKVEREQKHLKNNLDPFASNKSLEDEISDFKKMQKNFLTSSDDSEEEEEGIKELKDEIEEWKALQREMREKEKKKKSSQF